MRLDSFLTKYHNIQSRNKANELIKLKKVKVDGLIISKPSFTVNDNMEIEILENNFYVSRSAKKLKYFLEEIDISLENKIALDIGSSTGGFTQVLLENNVKNITCVDVGTNQLHNSLKSNKKIIIQENTDIRYFKSNIKYDIVTCDVSFISVCNILDSINLLALKDIIILFKPQFEVGKDVKRNKLGVVLDTDIVVKVRENFINETNKLNWQLMYSSISKIKGKEGNTEELFYFKI
jgi:23S rRNA (cytidine1920-2'-O)/16S rRNA (cytidine1409-2'-O)-methyltransferase